MTDVNMSLDDYAKKTGMGTRPRASKPRSNGAGDPSNTAGQRESGGGQRGGRGGGRGGRRERGARRGTNESTNSEDLKAGRSDNVDWKHDRFDAGRRTGRAPQMISRAGGNDIKGVRVQMVDVHFDITEEELQELLGDFTTNISIEFDESDRATGKVNIVCENIGTANAMVKKYGGMLLDEHPLNFKILPSRKANGNVEMRRGGPDDSRSQSRIQQFSETRGRGRRVRGGRGGRSEGRSDRGEGRAGAVIKEKREKKKPTANAPPKSAMDLDAEMEAFAMKNATPQSLNEQMAAYAASAAGDAPKEAAKAE